MPEVRKFIQTLFVYVFSALIAYSILLFTLTNIYIGGNRLIYRAVQGLVWKGGYSYERFHEYNSSAYYDVLVFGSSRANRGLDPSVFENAGFTMYNLGTDDQTPLNTSVLVKEYVRSNNCRIVIIDLYDKVFSAKPVESTADLIQNLKDDRVAWQMALASNDVRAINQFGARTMLKSKSPEYLPETDLYKGYRSTDLEFRYVHEKHIYNRNDVQLNALDETLKHLKSMNVQCYVVCQPLPHVPAAHAAFVKDVEKILSKYNMKLFDFTENRSLGSVEYFSDMCHFNSAGAARYSAFIVDSLISMHHAQDELAGLN